MLVRNGEVGRLQKPSTQAEGTEPERKGQTQAADAKLQQCQWQQESWENVPASTRAHVEGKKKSRKNTPAQGNEENKSQGEKNSFCFLI